MKRRIFLVIGTVIGVCAMVFAMLAVVQRDTPGKAAVKALELFWAGDLEELMAFSAVDEKILYEDLDIPVRDVLGSMRGSQKNLWFQADATTTLSQEEQDAYWQEYEEDLQESGLSLSRYIDKEKVEKMYRVEFSMGVDGEEQFTSREIELLICKYDGEYCPIDFDEISGGLIEIWFMGGWYQWN